MSGTYVSVAVEGDTDASVVRRILSLVGSACRLYMACVEKAI
jgi:hypothetical protein